MDLVSGCKDKLAYFRIKELKDILTQLGLSKQGKKQDLVDRILSILSDERGKSSGMWAKKNAVSKEEVAKLVDDTYRKMQVSGATDLASKGQSASDCSNTKFKDEIDDSYPISDKTRCLCGSSLQTDSMIKCEDPKCNVWQHINCVLIPEKPMEGFLPVHPEHFYCELCRLIRADPFWVTVGHPLNPLKLTITSVPADGTNPVQSVEKTFQLTRADKDLLAKTEYDVQAWCMLLNDKVSFRMQWPQFADLQVNGVPVRAINRPGSQLLGANGRDDGPIITACTRDGMNKISLTGVDARVFCFGVRIVKRRTLQHILNLIPKESDGERFEDALSRVRRCVGGGAATENADSDSDLEVVCDSIPFNLRCPMSGSRIKVSGRFKPCIHMGGFDLEVFVEMNQRSRKWQCPICLKNYSLEHIIIDPYFNRITSKMRNCGEDVTDIEVKPDGSWRAKPESDRRGLGDLAQWHNPDGTLHLIRVPEPSPKPVFENHKQVKQECVSEGHKGLKIGIRKNPNGIWEVSKAERNLENPEIIPMSSGGNTGSGGDDRSVNQDGGGGNFDFSGNNHADIDSIPLNLDSTSYAAFDQNQSHPMTDADVIILSDSDEEIETLVPSTSAYHDNNAANIIHESYNDDPALGPALGLFNTQEDEFGVPLWNLPACSQGVNPSFQLFGSDLENFPTTSMGGGGFSLAGETNVVPGSMLPESSGGLVGNIPAGFGGEDPSLQLFLPTRPLDSNFHSDDDDDGPRNQRDLSNGIRTEDWISLRLGGSSGAGCSGGAGAGEPPPVVANGINSRSHLSSKSSGSTSLADTASLLMSMNDNKSSVGVGGQTSNVRSNSPFSFPRQRRSVRPRLESRMEPRLEPRLYLSIDSESE